MAFKLGFTADIPEVTPEKVPFIPEETTPAPRRSVVRIYFPKREMTLSYYNDRFDLKVGDIVYVEGKLEGLRGRVVEVNYTFKIKLSDYKRVIALVDTHVSGEFFMAGSHFVTLDADAVSPEKARLWFKAPADPEEEILTGEGDGAFPLLDLKEMHVNSSTAERGHEYYMDNRVLYLSLRDGHGYALVEGSEVYEVEFLYKSGEIRNLLCTCYCTGHCKHAFATMLQLRDILDWMKENCPIADPDRTNFAAVEEQAFFRFAVRGKTKGSITL